MRFGVRRKILFGYLVVILVMIFVGLQGSNNLKNQSFRFTELIQSEMTNMRRLEELRADFLRKVGESRAFLIFQGAKQREAYMEASNIFNQHLEVLKSAYEDSEDIEVINKLESLNSAYDMSAQLAFSYAAVDFERGANYLAENSAPIVAQMRETINELVAQMDQKVADSFETEQKYQLKLFFSMVVTVAIGIIISLLLGLYISNKITKPLIIAKDALEKVAHGDYTVRTPVITRDEVGDLCQSLNMLTETGSEALRAIIHAYRDVNHGAVEMAKAVEQQAEASTQVTQAIDLVATGTIQQQDSIESANEAMRQLAHAIEQITEGAQEQAQSVDQTFEYTQAVIEDIKLVNTVIGAIEDDAKRNSEAAHQGKEGNMQVYESMENIEKGIKAAFESVMHLEEGSQRIGAIVNIINDISDQTNLLALNAAIEAARAGEHGRGFAVVADEVRVLAGKTRESTNEIADIVGDLGVSIESAIKAVEQTRVNVDEGARISQRSREMLDQIVESALKINSRVDELTTTVSSISDKSQQMELAMNNMAAITQESSAAAEEMNASTREFMENIENIANISRDNAASSEEVAAAMEEQNATLEELSASAGEFIKLAEKVQGLLSGFNV